MKKIVSILFLVSISISHLFAQSNLVVKTIDVFPYQESASISPSLSDMEKWTKKEWKSLIVMLNDDSLKLKSTYALNAFVNHVATDPAKAKSTATLLVGGLSSAKTYYAKQFIIQRLALLGDDVAVKALASLLSNDTYVGDASRALASIKSTLAIESLQNGLAKANEAAKKHIEAALDNVNRSIADVKSAHKSNLVFENPIQYLLNLQDRMSAAKNPVEKRSILAEAESIPGYGAFIFVSKSLSDPEVNKKAALIAARLALRDPKIRGREVIAALEKAVKLIEGEDSTLIVSKLAPYIEAMPYDNGFVSLFNGKDLSGWKALVGNPISRSKMTEKELQDAQQKANESTQGDWIVKDGLLVFTGHGDNLATTKQYGDFELFVDWKITEKGDAGIYLRGTPQVQIWDTSRVEVGAQVGSGGLYNNQKNERSPLVVADNKIGEWNTFHIIMIGDKVTVYLNGKLVVNNVVLENYWDHNLPIFIKEQIELQAHGTYVAYRNIYLREITSDYTIALSEDEKKQGFVSLFDGNNLDQWVGNKTGYLVEEGMIASHPENEGGNIYTKDEFANFIYRFEFQLTPSANNGLGIRAPLEGDAAYVGMELQILDNEADMYKSLNPYQYHGSVYGVIPSKRGYLKPIGEWNQQEVIANGSKIKVTLNGQVILEGDIKEASKNGTVDHNQHPGLLNKTGHIGFLGHGDVVRFRNIRIKKLK